ncbi:hypothetical protein F511_22792 [Dorcoceras hygrometricum]|uniref:Splicing factor 3B subunit 1-like n=1 Tax=Dorcoceras hygrometricum TaxID=472368 RepID=A0A2Z7C4Q2_9LAMI|nr:hypothetical protein F511_22792 [Dorcoceras hygrometricum]
MAASMIHNALQVKFDSVLRFPDEGMVQLFKALESTRLRGFLGCPSVLYEDDLILFDILKDMVTKSSKQAKVFAAQICALLKRAQNLTLGEAKIFPPIKILTVKTVGTYVAKNQSIIAEEVADEPKVEKVVKKAAAKRRPAPAAEPVANRKRTTLGRATLTEKNLAIVPVATEAEPISVIPAGSFTVQRRQAPKRKLILQESDDEQYEEETVEEIVAKVIVETTEIDTEETESRIDVSSITNYDQVISLKVLSNEEGPLVETEKEKEKEKEKEIEKEAADKRNELRRLLTLRR